MKKKDPARAWRKFPLHLKGSRNKAYDSGFYDNTFDIERTLNLNGPGHLISEDMENKE